MSFELTKWHYGLMKVTGKVHSRYYADVAAAHHRSVRPELRAIADIGAHAALGRMQEHVGTEKIKSGDFKFRIEQESRALDEYIWLTAGEVVESGRGITKRRKHTKGRLMGALFAYEFGNKKTGWPGVGPLKAAKFAMSSVGG